MIKKRSNISINYLSRDFDSIKSDLIRYAQRYYPDTFRDYSTAGFGALMLDTVAYVGDVLSFYLDYQANESFLATAIEYENILKHGEAMGYKHYGSRQTYGVVELYILVPPNSSATGPDMDYAPILRQGSAFSSNNGSRFTLITDVNFSDSNNEIVVATTNSSTGAPTQYAIKASGQVVSGEDRTLEIESENLGNFLRFRRINLPLTTTDIVSVTDADGNEYFEVENLSQNVVYAAIPNDDTTTNVEAPAIVKPIIVPRRFMCRRTINSTEIIFGYGSESELSSPSMVEPRDVVLNLHSKNYVTDSAFDPSNLIQTDKFGVSPSNTTIRVDYRVNTTQNSNAASRTITDVSVADFEFPNSTSLAESKMTDVRSSLEVANESPINGDISPPNIDELRQLIAGVHSAQNRAVTASDYKAMVLAMPANYGGIKRCSVVQDVDSNLRNINIYVISESLDGFLQTSNNVLKQNVKTWLNSKRLINDSVDILDAKIVNLKIEFEAISVDGANTVSVLNEAVGRLSALYETKMDVGESFSITDVYSTLNAVPNLADTISVKVTRASGTGYSTTNLNIKSQTTPDGRYIRAPKNVIFEVKYPNVDIQGTMK